MIRWIVRAMSGDSDCPLLLALLAFGLTASTAAAQGSGGGNGGAQSPPAAPNPTEQEAAGRPAPSSWIFAGDFRLRYEDTTKQEPGAVLGLLDPRHRMVIRLRGGVTKKITNQVDFGVRLATGARGDPNTTDVTLGNFVDKLEVSLDRVYLGWVYRNISLYGGRFVNPLVRTELVWDDDVNPQGVAGTYTFSQSTRVIPKFTAVYSIVDEQTSNPDSYMAGGQMQVRIQSSNAWNLTVAGGFYDYTIKSLTNADAGDTLSNRLNDARTTYLSDFDLLNAVAIVDSRALGERWPIRVSGDWVKNLGAAKGEDEGFSLDATIGRGSARKDARFRYGFARAETDAVLAAFSHDNTTFATNYVQHTMSVDYVVSPNAMFTLTWYVYKRDQVAVDAGPELDRNFVSRLRLNATVSF